MVGTLRWTQNRAEECHVHELSLLYESALALATPVFKPLFRSCDRQRIASASGTDSSIMEETCFNFVSSEALLASIVNLRRWC